EQGVVLGRLGRAALGRDDDVSIEEAMTLGPSTVRPSYELDAAIERMHKQDLTSLPVTRSDGVLVGVLGRDDAERAVHTSSGVERVTGTAVRGRRAGRSSRAGRHGGRRFRDTQLPAPRRARTGVVAVRLRAHGKLAQRRPLREPDGTTYPRTGSLAV